MNLDKAFTPQISVTLAPVIARAMLCALFLIFAVIKIMNFDQTVASMTKIGTPAPVLFAWIAIIVEGPLALLVLAGILFRPLCLFFVVYTLITGVIGHAYWSVPPEQYMGMLTHFYKNVAIAGGFLALYAAGPGRYSLSRSL